MILGGWERDASKEGHSTKCRYCGVEYKDWQSGDDLKVMHDLWSPLCPFLQASQSMSPSPTILQSPEIFFRTQTAGSDMNILPMSFLQRSKAQYALPPRRETIFASFHGGAPDNTESLVKSGFYYTGVGTYVRCYQCQGTANDLHLLSAVAIDNQHRQRFPACRFAQLLPKEGDVQSLSE